MTPAALAFAAYARPFAALRGQDIGVPGIGFAPVQVILELAASTVWLGWFEPPMANARIGPNCASIGLAQDAFVGVKHSSTLARFTQRRIAGVLLADRLSKITNSR
jgi:hypothetical protein